MENIFWDFTEKSPAINCDQDCGKIEIKGKSGLLNPDKFYQPLIKWIDEYAKHPKEITTVDIRLEYFNTRTSKSLLEIFRRLENKLHLDGHNVDINWYYDKGDDDLFESGQDYASLLQIPFKIREAEE